MNNQIQYRLIAGLLLGMMVVLAACQPIITATPTESPQNTQSATVGPSPTDATGDGNPFAPQPNDEKLKRGKVEIDAKELMIKESYPVQISLHLTGNLPTPCHQLRADIPAAGEDQRINIDVYSVVDPDQMCAQVLEPFEVNISLGSFEEQGVTFLVNGEKVGEY